MAGSISRALGESGDGFRDVGWDQQRGPFKGMAGNFCFVVQEFNPHVIISDGFCLIPDILTDVLCISFSFHRCVAFLLGFINILGIIYFSSLNKSVRESLVFVLIHMISFEFL